MQRGFNSTIPCGGQSYSHGMNNFLHVYNAKFVVDSYASFFVVRRDVPNQP